jgi:crotonobetainyl-CoA:carnitine CoA-transferase CaiB-like acyl-CoA transferase
LPAASELAETPTGPFRDVRILDLTGVVFGAYATQILADQGADVIKVEFPGGQRGDGGDIMRWNGITPPDAPRDLGPVYMTINRNKRAVLLDLRQERPMRFLRRLIKTCDVLAATVRYDGLKRLGLDYESVKAIRPDIVYCHGAGYGSDGPYAGDPAYDDLIQAQSGLADLLCRTDGNPAPRYMPNLVADKVAGLFMSQAISAALYNRGRTGEGQFVEVPMLECVVSFNMVENLFNHVYEPPTGQWAYPRAVNPNRKPFPTKDGFLGVLPMTDTHWKQFFELAGWADTVGKDPRFADFASRLENVTELYQLVEQATRQRTSDEWVALLKPLQIPVAKMNRLDELMDDPHLKEVGMFQRLQHPAAGAYNAVRPPVTFSATPSNIRRHPPRLGQDTEALMAEIGDDPEA